MTEILSVALVPLALAVFAAWLILAITRDRGQVDKERAFLVADGAQLFVGPDQYAMLKIGAEKMAVKPVAYNADLISPALLGVPVVVSEALASRTRW